MNKNCENNPLTDEPFWGYYYNHRGCQTTDNQQQMSLTNVIRGGLCNEKV